MPFAVSELVAPTQSFMQSISRCHVLRAGDVSERDAPFTQSWPLWSLISVRPHFKEFECRNIEMADGFFAPWAYLEDAIVSHVTPL